MKAAAFDYAVADSLDEACALLARHGDAAKIIAGGQSLVPMLAMRLLAPAWLIDVARLSDLQRMTHSEKQAVIGACVRQCVAESDLRLRQSVPLLGKALRWVGHAATRNRGTIGGSMVHADPSAELPLVATTLDAVLTATSTRGARRIDAGNFFTGPLMTTLEPDECLAEISLPIWRGGRTGCAFEEIAARMGDFAMVAVAAQVSVEASGRCTRAALGIGGAGPVPRAFVDLASRLVGSRLEDGLLREVAQAAAAQLEPANDVQASAAYRRHLAGVLAERALRSARQEAIA
jgi:CO/xanthine dehydrogenase FAD-binding subunit